MAKPVIFTISTVWDDKASVWTGALRRYSRGGGCSDAG